jgi:Ser/Thr protein kinase RdoA (MazF antagonist)
MDWMSASLKVHGLDGALVAPDWPALTLVELRQLFERLPDLGAPIGIAFTSPRPLSAAAVVNTARGRFFVKRHARVVRDREGLLEEHRFMGYVRGRGALVPRVLADIGGDTAIEIGASTYEVHEIAEGVDIYADAISWTPFFYEAHAREAGRAMAQLHLAAAGFDAPRRKVQPLVASFTIFAAQDASAAMQRYLGERGVLACHDGVQRCVETVLEILTPYHGELLPLLPHLSPLWTHNDLHASNLLWSSAEEGARATSLIDFGLADRTNAVHDLVNAIERNVVEWLSLVQNPDEPKNVRVHFDHLQALLNGYESVRRLSDEEAAALAPMTALCHAEFALSEADYFLGVLHSEENARRAYDGYLMGHSRWFRSAPGVALLDAIRRWADSRRKGLR